MTRPRLGSRAGSRGAMPPVSADAATTRKPDAFTAGRESHDDVLADDTMLFYGGDDDVRSPAAHADEEEEEEEVDDEPDVVSSRPRPVDLPAGVQLGSSLPINIPAVGSMRNKRL